MQICDICGEKLSKRERKGSIKRCADCWEHYQIEELRIITGDAGHWREAYLKMAARHARSFEQDDREWGKLQRKLAKVKERLASVETDRDILAEQHGVLEEARHALMANCKELAEKLRVVSEERDALYFASDQWFRKCSALQASIDGETSQEHPSCDNAPASTLTSPRS